MGGNERLPNKAGRHALTQPAHIQTEAFKHSPVDAEQQDGTKSLRHILRLDYFYTAVLSLLGKSGKGWRETN